MSTEDETYICGNGQHIKFGVPVWYGTRLIVPLGWTETTGRHFVNTAEESGLPPHAMFPDKVSSLRSRLKMVETEIEGLIEELIRALLSEQMEQPK